MWTLKTNTSFAIIKLVLDFIFAYITALSGAVFSTSYPTRFLFSFSGMFGLAMHQGQPLLPHCFLPLFTKHYKRLCRGDREYSPRGCSCSGSWSILDLQGGKGSCSLIPAALPAWLFGGCKSLLVAPARTLLGTSSQTWATAGLWTPFIQDKSILLLYGTPWNSAGNPRFPVLQTTNDNHGKSSINTKKSQAGTKTLPYPGSRCFAKTGCK